MMMNARESDCIARLASSDAAALAELYDAHADAVYGLGLLVTRNARHARYVLIETFRAAATSPERLSRHAGVRRALLAVAHEVAWKTRRTRVLLPCRPSSALRRETPTEVKTRLDAALPDEAEEAALRAAEGCGVRDVLEETTTGGVSDSALTGVAWTAAPRSLRSLVLLRASDAVRPARRYARLFAVWAVFALAIASAVATELAAPSLPTVPYEPPPASISGHQRRAVDDHRAIFDITRGFREERKR